jgi:hypothetical protein
MFCDNVLHKTACSKHGVLYYTNRDVGPYFPRSQCTLLSSATFYVLGCFQSRLTEQLVWLENIWEQP